MINRDDFLKALTLKTEIIKLDSLDGAEVEIRDYTIDEFKKVEEVRQKVINKEIDEFEFFKISCKYGMVEPFTDEEMSKFGLKGYYVLMEITRKIPTIGMSDTQKMAYENAVNENLAKEIKKLSKDETEKKQSKSKSSSLN